jgi:indolepyruvate ferredoxin oxidoreductase beta subunit
MLMRLLARMRILRRSSWRYAQEEAFTSRWLKAVKEAASIEYNFGVEVAECADLLKGYSGTYRRGVHNFDLVFNEVVDPAIRSKQPAAKQVSGARAAANSDPEGDALDRYLQVSKA